jgi:hypothetical protein
MSLHPAGMAIRAFFQPNGEKSRSNGATRATFPTYANFFRQGELPGGPNWSDMLFFSVMQLVCTKRAC